MSFFSSFMGGASGAVIGQAVVQLVADSSKLDADLQKAESRTERTAGRMDAALTKFSIAATAGMVAAGGASIVMAAQFESAMTKIETLVGLSREQVQGMKGDVLALAGETARSPRELADALFVVTSAGERGANAMLILEQAAKASAIGLGDTATIARTVTAAMQAYGSENLDAERATNILTATVREGNLEAASLAGTLGKVLGPAAQLGIEFSDLGAFIAVYTRLGGDASEATTSLSAVMTTMIKPSKQAQDALDSVGLSMSDIRRIATEEGLAQAIFTITDAFEGNDEALATVIPNIRALRGVLAVAGNQAETFTKVQEDMRGELNLVADGFARVQEDAEFKAKQALNSVKVEMVEIGTTALPLVASGLGLVSTGFAAWSVLPQRTQMLALAFGAITLALPAVIALVSGVTGVVRSMQVAMVAGGAATDALSLKLKLMGGATIIGVALIALDLMINKLGLFSSGASKADEAADRLSRALKQNGDTAAHAGGQLSLVEVVLREAGKSMEGWEEVLDKARLGSLKAGGEFGAMAQEIEGLAKGMVSANATTDELKAVFDALPPAFQKVFGDTVHLTEALERQEERLADVIRGWDATADALTGADLALANATRAIEAGRSPREKYIRELGLMEDGTWNADRAVKGLKESLDRLNGAFSDTHPEAAKLRIEGILLREEAEGLRSRIDELTEAEKARLDQLEKDLIPANDRATLGFESNKQAVSDLTEELERVMGVEGVEGLRLALVALEVPQEEQIQMLGKIANALVNIETGAIPDAIAGFEELKGTLDEDEWAAIAEAVGPAFLETLQTSIADPTELARLIIVANRLGINIGDGVVQGFENTPISGGVGRFVNRFLDLAKAAVQSHSPSKLFADEVGQPIGEGIIVGAIAALRDSDFDIGDGFDLEKLKKQLTGDFGKLGGDAAWAFMQALASRTKGTEQTFFKAIDNLIEEAKRAGVPDAEALGQLLIDTMAEGLSGNPALVAAGLEMIADFEDKISTAITEAAGFTVDEFDIAFQEAWDRAMLKEKVGSQGLSLIDALNDAIEGGGPSAQAKVASLAAGILGTLTAGLSPDEASAITAKFMAVIRNVIAQEGGAAIQDLIDLLAEIEGAGSGSTPKAKPVTSIGATSIGAFGGLGKGADVKDLAQIANVFGVSLEELLGMSKDEIGGLWSQLSNPGEFFNLDIQNMLKSFLGIGADSMWSNMSAGSSTSYVINVDAKDETSIPAIKAAVEEVLEEHVTTGAVQWGVT